MEKRLCAIRGATTVDVDDAASIVEETASLLREMLERNEVDHEEIVCVFFSATGDLHTAFPAAGAHEMGLVDVALFGSRELDVHGSIERCIRVMVQCYLAKSHDELRHVYLKGATVLRRDLAG